MLKVLVIRFSSLGDIVLTAPVFQALRSTWPEAEITALVKEDFRDVLAQNPHLDHVMTLRKGESLPALIQRVRAEHFDVVIDLHSNLRSWFVRLFSGASRRVRYRKAALARRLFVRWRWRSQELERHTLERYLATLSELGLPNPGPLPQRIVLIQTAFLGDAVLTTPLLTALKEHYPQASISVLCTPEIFEVFHRHPAVAELILYDKRGKEGSIKGLWRAIRALRQGRFDIAFIPHRSFKSALMGWLADIPRRIGFTSSQGRWLLTDRVPFQWGVHDADRNLALLRAVGATPGAGELWVRPEPEAQKRIVQRLKAAGIQESDFLIGINAGSVWPTKRWLPEGFAAVADRAIRELGARVIFFGGPKDRDAALAVQAEMEEKALNWVGETNLSELIAGIARCQTFLTNDSGPMHIAVGARVPTVAIFGPTTRELGFFPYGAGHSVVEKNLDCRPCGLHGAKECPLGHFRCMKDISPQDVFQALVKQVQKVKTLAGAQGVPEQGTVPTYERHKEWDV